MIYFITNNTELFSNDTYTITTPEFALDYLNKLDEVECDTETTGLIIHIDTLLCFQLGHKENQFVIVPEYLQLFKELLESKLLIFANAKFDLRFFREKGIIISNVYDVFLAACVLTTGYGEEDERGLALEDMALRFCGVKLDKSIRGKIFNEGLTSRVIKYAAEDVTYLSEIKAKQLALLEHEGLLNTIDLENKAVIAFAALEFNGVKIDTVKWLEVAKEVSKLLLIQENKLDSVLLSNPKKFIKFLPRYTQSVMSFVEQPRHLKINWSSNQQKLKILQASGSKITSVGERELQRIKKTNTLAKELLEYNKYSKLESSFGLAFLKHINPNTGRVHCNIWQIVSTGRISVKEPNLNQIPSKGEFGKLIRSCFIPEEGNSIVGGDYSGMELRIIAEFSKDPIWLQAFDEGKDLHSILCSMTFGIPIEDVKKPFPQKPDISYRDIQKTINFGLAYGMTEYKLSDTMDIDTKAAKSIIDKFFKAVPFVDKLLTDFGNLAKQRGFIRTAAPFRRVRWFPRWNNAYITRDFVELGVIERAGKNTPIQGTNGDIIKWALHLTQTKIDKEKLPIKILLSVYDEIRTECPDGIAEWWKLELNKIMIEAAQYVLKRVPVELDCKITKCWEK